MEDKGYIGYLENYKDYIQKADEYISQGDSKQASEKLWGAASQVVKAYAEKNNLPHNGHRLLWNVVKSIAKKYNEPELVKAFGFANTLHVNFYDDFLTIEYIEVFAPEIKSFCEKMKGYIENE